MPRSQLMTKDRQALIELCKQMTPQERLMAFYHHSRLLRQVHEAGKKFRKKSSQSRLKNKT